MCEAVWKVCGEGVGGGGKPEKANLIQERDFWAWWSRPLACVVWSQSSGPVSLSRILCGRGMAGFLQNADTGLNPLNYCVDLIPLVLCMNRKHFSVQHRGCRQRVSCNSAIKMDWGWESSFNVFIITNICTHNELSFNYFFFTEKSSLLIMLSQKRIRQNYSLIVIIIIITMIIKIQLLCQAAAGFCFFICL